ncbi:hypothetical protein V500_00687 [Pseudogymnoascus sp. VKM F-4518 (FW-2643)]|nr:hypothetical protein V500_00687 [Pseudogymnoascus sp. VKM F-4518 (FW-2643)]
MIILNGWALCITYKVTVKLGLASYILNTETTQTFPDEHLDAYPSYYPRNVVEESVRPFRKGLVKAYFEYVHTSFALLGPQIPSTIAKSATLMSSIYCLAQAYFTPAQSLDPWLFTDFNKQALHIETHNVKLETVEAALLFAQRHARLIRAPTMPGMCAEIGSIIGMSHDLGLNIDPIDWDISDTERRRRRRLWWGVYVQDKWSALTLGRPSYLHDEQNDVSMLTMADFALEGSLQPSPANEKPAQLFIGVTTLSVILSNILANFFTVKAINSRQTMALDELESICTSFEDKLKKWQVTHLEPALVKRSFPDPTGLKPYINASYYASNLGLGSLELAFYTVQITLYRVILRSVLSKFSKSDPFFAHLRQRGKVAASSVLKLLEVLSVARSSAFWWSTSKINFAIAGSFMISMFLCSVSSEEGQYWMDQVMFYRKLLRAHINGFDVTKHASIRLDLLANCGSASELPKSPPDITCQAQQSMARSEGWEIENVLPMEDLDMDWLSSLPAESPFNMHNFGLI